MGGNSLIERGREENYNGTQIRESVEKRMGGGKSICCIQENVHYVKKVSLIRISFFTLHFIEF